MLSNKKYVNQVCFIKARIPLCAAVNMLNLENDIIISNLLYAKYNSFWKVVCLFNKQGYEGKEKHNLVISVTAEELVIICFGLNLK